jgi:DNA processing protein
VRLEIFAEQMTAREIEYYIALSHCEGIGSRRLVTLITYFGSAERAFFANKRELTSVPGIGAETADSLSAEREASLAVAKQDLGKLDESTKLLTYFDERYPQQLRDIFNPPALLYTRGNIELLKSERFISVIGTRRATDYGKRWTKTIVDDLIKHDITIVSGFAQGIDTHAHIAAFREGGKTIAVLGSGVDVIYPHSNKAFAKQLIENERGLLISELPMGAPPDARNFPWRNRIVSGLSKATIIVESDEKGGSMITASMALDENREVFAVPGDLDRPSSAGPNMLIRESRAKLVRSPLDILIDLGWADAAGRAVNKKPLARTSFNLFENKVLDVLEGAGGPLHIDNLAERAELEVQDLLVHLLQLEFKGVVRQMAGKQFSLIS